MFRWTDLLIPIFITFFAIVLCTTGDLGNTNLLHVFWNHMPSHLSSSAMILVGVLPVFWLIDTTNDLSYTSKTLLSIGLFALMMSIIRYYIAYVRHDFPVYYNKN